MLTCVRPFICSTSLLPTNYKENRTTYHSMTSRYPTFAFVELVSPYNKKNITCWLEDMNLMFSWHWNIKFISSRHRVISSIYQRYLMRIYLKRYIVRAIVLFLGEISLSLCEISFDASDVSFPLWDISFWLCDILFPLRDIYRFCFAIYRFSFKRYRSSLSSQHCEIQVYFPKIIYDNDESSSLRSQLFEMASGEWRVKCF